MLMLVMCLLLEAIILALSVRKYHFLPYPHGIYLIIMGMQVALSFVYYGVAEHYILYSFSSFSFFENFELIVFYLFVYYCAITISLVRVSSGKVVHVTEIIRERIDGFFNNANAKLVINLIIIVIYIHMFALAAFLNWSVVWENDTYLGMFSDTVLSPFNIFSWFLIQINLLMALIASSLLAYNYSTRAYVQSTILFPVVMMQFLYYLAASSRGAVLILGTFAVLVFVLKRSKYVLVGFSILAVIILNYVLKARGFAYFGVSTLWDVPVTVINQSTDDLFRSFLNAFEGVFVIAEYSNFHHDYPFIYKALSFSPFPSFIDGFSSILVDSYVGLNPFVPPSAIMEARSFGIPYIVLYFLVQLVAGRASLSYVVKTGTFLSLFCNFLVFFAMYLQWAYPVRNVFRFFVIALVIIFFASKFLKAKDNEDTGKPVAPKVKSQESSLPPAVLRRRRKLAASFAVEKHLD